LNRELTPLNRLTEIVLATGEDFDRIFNVNVRGLFLCYKYAARQMVEQGRGGRIIGASSAYGKQGPSSTSFMIDSLNTYPLLRKGAPNLPLYSASKFAVRGLTQSLGTSVRWARLVATAECYADL
jgi:NAD(P)-dependent dehydrogenase (short-subunit alcohol dehydrogenase family)